MHNASVHHHPRSSQPLSRSDRPADAGQLHPVSGGDTPARRDSAPGQHDSSDPLLDEIASLRLHMGSQPDLRPRAQRRPSRNSPSDDDLPPYRPGPSPERVRALTPIPSPGPIHVAPTTPSPAPVHADPLDTDIHRLMAEIRQIEPLKSPRLRLPPSHCHLIPDKALASSWKAFIQPLDRTFRISIETALNTSRASGEPRFIGLEWVDVSRADIEGALVALDACTEALAATRPSDDRRAAVKDVKDAMDALSTELRKAGLHHQANMVLLARNNPQEIPLSRKKKIRWSLGDLPQMGMPSPASPTRKSLHERAPTGPRSAHRLRNNPPPAPSGPATDAT